MELLVICLLLFLWNIYLTIRAEVLEHRIKHCKNCMNLIFDAESKQSEMNMHNQTMFKILASEVFGVSEEELLKIGRGEEDNERKL